VLGPGYPRVMSSVRRSSTVAGPPRAGRRRRDAPQTAPRPNAGAGVQALLLFFYSPTSGPSRRMDGLVSWLYVRERKRLRLRLVNVDVAPETARRFGVAVVPTLLLIKGREVVARVEGKATGQQIDDAMLPHLRP
jgi:thioredoxin